MMRQLFAVIKSRGFCHYAHGFIKTGHCYVAGGWLHFRFNMGTLVLLVLPRVHMRVPAAALCAAVYRLMVAGADA